tara:strand:+ start:24 stop:386 length:363 start_codon:yes stop_codon:yes gene_type:complete
MITEVLPIINIMLLFILIYFIYMNRRLLDDLKTDINTYIRTDMDNLKTILETTMHNDKKLQEKTDFILDVLEEDDQVVYEKKDDSSITNLDNISVPSGESDAWIENVTSTKAFKSLLGAV